MKNKSFNYETVDDFAAKMDYEGGIYEFASYGCEACEIKDKDLSKLWSDFMKHFEKANEIATKITKYIEKNGPQIPY